MTDADKESDDGPGNFVRELAEEQLADGRVSQVVTRFPPEPNGYLHVGHAKSICLNFGLAKDLGGRCNLRFDDTNPEAEDTEYVEAIKRDVRWLGFEWDEERYASDYFEQLYEWAERLVEAGKAYVDEQSIEAIREGRGSFHEPGTESPHRDRPPAESLKLLRAMRAGELEEGSCVLRAKIDMQSPDLKLRDPLMYRIRKVHHHRTGDAWPIYPMYDWAHGQSDAIEGVTHSICSLEFVNHRALYEWFLDALEIERPPQQVEFAKLALTYVLLSKRRLLRMVEGGVVDGWDDPRMPTIAGMRRRGYPPEALRAFCERVGVSRRDSLVDIGLLEHALREDLNARCARMMGVLDPLKVTLTNFPEGEVDELDCPFYPDDDSFGSRKVPFTRELYIEREDFMVEPMKKWFRLAPGREVRLRYAALITCDEVVEDAQGNVVELKCTWDPESRGGTPADGRKVKGTLHWVSASHSVDAEVRLYDRLFTVENPGADERDYLELVNPDSKRVISNAKLERSVVERAAGEHLQLERIGYFITDAVDHTAEAPVLNRTITLRDSWAKIAKQQPKPGKPKHRQPKGTKPANRG